MQEARGCARGKRAARTRAQLFLLSCDGFCAILKAKKVPVAANDGFTGARASRDRWDDWSFDSRVFAAVAVSPAAHFASRYGKTGILHFVLTKH